MSLVTTIFGLVISSKLAGVKDKLEDALTDINNIKSTTTKLNKFLEGNIKGGQDVFVGLNTKELRSNEVYAFEDNKIGLKAGNEIFLSNHLDDRYQTMIRCIVVRTPTRNGDTSKASIFISADAARRLGLFDPPNQKWQGLYQLKLTRKNSEETTDQ